MSKFRRRPGGTEAVAPPFPPSVILSVSSTATLFDTCPHLGGQDDDRNRLDLALELERPTLPTGGVDGGLARVGIGDQQLAGTGRRREAGGRRLAFPGVSRMSMVRSRRHLMQPTPTAG